MRSLVTHPGHSIWAGLATEALGHEDPEGISLTRIGSDPDSDVGEQEDWKPITREFVCTE